MREDLAVKVIKEKGLIPVNVSEEKQIEIGNVLPFLDKVSELEIIVFTRQLAVMLDSGLPIVRALQALKDQVRDKKLAEVVGEIIDRIDGGASLHESMSRHPEVFSELYLSLIKAGEKSGNLVEVLKRLAETMQRSHDFKAETKSAMIYPAIIVAVMIAVMLLMFIFVIPQLRSLYESMGAELPITTKIMLGISQFTVSKWWVLLIALAGGIYGFKKFKESEQGKEVLSKVQLKLPVFGGLIRQVQFTTFTRTLAMLLSSGLPILECLEISAQTLNNVVFRQGINDAAKGVEKGSNLGDELDYNDNFPSILSEMVKVGEQSGRLSDVLADLSEYFENESLRTLENLSSLLEPIIMVFLGVAIGFLIVSLILPIYSLTSQF